MLKIENLRARTGDQEILRGIYLEMEPGQVHAIMGPNGAGKSTLAKVLGGHPAYEVLGGSVTFEGKDLLELEPEERAKLGLFMSFQYPVEIPGVTNEEFLRAALKGVENFDERFREAMEQVGVRPEFAQRGINEGFSGGEKKRNEILQLALLEPKLAILDETDSGLDIDALKIVAEGVNHWMNEKRSLLLITHYQRLLDYIRPDHVHVMVDGAIVQSGGPELALHLEAEGYAELC
jgi:Fe-S cluster assembly ATP-binding protein